MVIYIIRTHNIYIYIDLVFVVVISMALIPLMTVQLRNVFLLSRRGETMRVCE